MFSKLKVWIFNKTFDEKLKSLERSKFPTDVSSSKKSSEGLIAGIITALGIRNGDSGSTDYQDPEYTLSTIASAYDADSYIRQGVDKYVDQIFKEGWTLYGKNIKNCRTLAINHWRCLRT